MKRENISEFVMLRQKAEVLLKTKTAKLRKQLSEAEMQRLIHELEVHQIELEMQNDELVRAKEQSKLYYQKYIVLKECVPTKESLLASEARYRRLFESSKDGILILNAETGIILDVNPFLIEMLGYSEDQFLDKAIWKIGFFKDIFANHENFLELQQKEYVRYDDLPLEMADGSKINVELISNVYLLENREVIQFNIRDITERRKAEDALLESEKRFRAIFDQAPIAIALIDEQWHPIIYNLPLSKMFGYSSDELIKMKFTDFTYPEDIDKDMNQFTDLIAARITDYKTEKRYIHKNGDLIWANLFVTKLSDNHGLPGEIIGMVEDITQRKNSEKEIAMLAHSLKSINECVSITDLDNKIIFVNESFLNTYGYEINELIGKNISVVSSQFNDKIKVDEILPATILGAWQGELLNRRKDGSEFSIYLSTSIVKDKDGQPIGLIGVATDISDRKRSEETFLKLSSAIEQTVDSIVITDRNGTIEYVNHAFETLTGYSYDDAVGKTPRILKSGIYDQEYYEKMWKTIISGRVFKEDIVNKKKNGDLYEEEETISPIFDKNKNITHFVGSGVNISKRKIAEKELIEAKEHAEESDRLKSAFLANMSHEIRSPLNSIIGFSDLLADPDYDGNQKSEFLRHIIASGNNLLTIISDIMDISKLESGEITIHNSQINVLGFIENVKGKFSYLTERNNVELRLTLPDKDEETIIFADTERLYQIFNNLISNAFKFTVKGQIEIGYQLNGKMTEFFVKDSGIGIPTEYHTKIFDRFRQVENPFTRKFGGNGLGLAISKKLVELMGGKIWVVSDSGVGSVFYFTVPIFQCVNHATNS